MTLLPGIRDYGEVNGVLLDTYAWRVVDRGYDELLNCPPVRGTSLVMPGARGRRPYPTVVDEMTVGIPMLITGEYDEDGNPQANKRRAMFEHRDYLRENLGIADGGDPDDGTVPFQFHRDGLNDWIGDVIVLGFFGFTRLGDHDALIRLDIRIPDGDLSENGS